MAEADDVRRLAPALPNVTEIKSEGFDFRLADRGFVWSYPQTGQATADLGADAWRMRVPEAFIDNRNKSGHLPSADLG